MCYLNKRYFHNEDFIYAQNSQGDIVVVDVQDSTTNKGFVIKGLAKDVFTGINGETNVNEILKVIIKREDIKQIKALEDRTNDFLEKLLSLNLIKSVD